MIGAGAGFIGRKSFALVENSYAFIHIVENKHNISYGRNPLIDVEKHTTGSDTVEI